MLINVIKANSSVELRQIQVGQNLCGLRILSVVIEGPKEIQELTTPKGIDWLKSIIRQFKVGII